MPEKKPHMNIVFVGHIDHGKSTTVGRIFYDTGAVSQQELDKLKKEAESLGKATFEFAYVTDATKEERKRGITIDLTHMKFETGKYYFTVIDAPGHRDFVKNMITGASQADAAVLVIDVGNGIQPQTREHAYLCKVMGVNQMIVAANKMDTVNYEQKKYDELVAETKKLLQGIGYKMEKVRFIPIASLKDDNIVKPSPNMPWFKGDTLVAALDGFEVPPRPSDMPLRIPVQDVYSITGVGTVPVGRVVTGVMKVGDKIRFNPAGKDGEIKSIEMHHENVEKAEPGDNIGFNVRGVGKTDIKRGDVGGPINNPPTIAKEFKAQIIVLAHPTVLTAGYSPVFHCHTAQTACKFKSLDKKIDPKTGATVAEKPDFLKNGDAAFVTIEPTKPFVIESKATIPQMSSFAIRDMGATIAAGVCTEVSVKG